VTGMLSIGLQHLRLSEFFEEMPAPSAEDRARLLRGSHFLKRILAAYDYFEEGQTEYLDESAISQAFYVQATEKKLRKAAGSPKFRGYLKHLDEALSDFITNNDLDAKDKKELEFFFEVVGEAMVSEVIDTEREDNSGFGNDAGEALALSA
jgi:hypothetical protein